MTTRELLTGNEALAEAAIRAECRGYFSYPITPASEILKHMAVRMPQVGGVFLQPESELAAINMVFGAASAGKRAMTSSSSTGISLMQETISSLVEAQLPCVIVNIMRAGPGLGSIAPSQADYFQATKAGSHGDCKLITLAPSSVQEMADLTTLAFDLADKYRNPAMILADGIVGQMMEPMVWPERTSHPPEKPWAITGATGRERNLVLLSPLTMEGLMELNEPLKNKFAEIAAKEQRWESYYLDDARVVLVAFGIAARVALEAVEEARSDGIPAGLIRPISLWPFPVDPLQNLPEVESILVVELNNGQMVEDVRLAINGRVPVRFYGFGGGWLPNPPSVKNEIEHSYRELVQ